MKKVKITVRAVRFVGEHVKRFEMQEGPGYVGVIMWQTGASGIANFVPNLCLGFEKRDAIDRSRVMECDGRDVEVYQYAPDELFEKDGQKLVDVRNDRLVLAEDSVRARQLGG